MVSHPGVDEKARVSKIVQHTERESPKETLTSREAQSHNHTRDDDIGVKHRRWIVSLMTSKKSYLFSRARRRFRDVRSL